MMDDLTQSHMSNFDQNQPRQRMRSWLTEQLNTDYCPGCTWINKDIGVFKLTWKHYGRPGFDEDKDAKIFREWARHTKRYTPGDPSDVSTWKTRFRNALHKMADVEEMATHHQLDGNDPYRVYRFRTQEEMERIKKATTTTTTIPTPYPVPSHYNLPPTPNYSQPPVSPYSVISEPNSPYVTSNSASPNQNIVNIQQYLQDEARRENVANRNAYIPTFTDADFDDVIDIFMKEAMASNGTASHLSTSNATNPHHLISPEYSSSVNTIPITALGFKLYLSDKEVGTKVLNNINGVRIAYQPPPPVPNDIVQGDAKEVLSDMYGPLQAYQLYFPQAEDRNSQQMLLWIRRGLVIEAKPNGDIYATRLCQAKVFYADNVLNEPEPLERSKATMVFNFQNSFLPLLGAYRSGIAGMPSCEVHFSFGQKWSTHEPLNEVLVRCSVTHFLSKKLFKDARNKKPMEKLISAPNYIDVLRDEFETMALAEGQQRP